MTIKVTPGLIMHQIRDGVREGIREPEEIVKVPEIGLDFGTLDQDVRVTIEELNTTLHRLKHRITPNIPVAFLDPMLTSRYKLLGKIIVPLRKIGTRLFTKWYADTFKHQQKHLNHDVWYGLNSAIEIINKQNSLIMYLIKKSEELEKKANKTEK